MKQILFIISVMVALAIVYSLIDYLQHNRANFRWYRRRKGGHWLLCQLSQGSRKGERFWYYSYAPEVATPNSMYEIIKTEHYDQRTKG